MEKITEVLENIFDSFKNRLKNPFIGTFTISWLIINWKPVYFVLFSKNNVEYKIDYVSMCFTNYWMILFWPSISTIFYMLFVPYINLYFEKGTKHSTLERNRIRKNDKVTELNHEADILIAEINRDHRKTEALEANNNALAAKESQKQIDQITKLYNDEKDKLSDMQSGYLDQIKSIEDRNKIAIQKLQADLNSISKDRYEKDMKLKELNSELNEKILEISQLKEYENFNKSSTKSLQDMIADLEKKLDNQIKAKIIAKDKETESSRIFNDKIKHLEKSLSDEMLKNNNIVKDYKEDIDFIRYSKDQDIVSLNKIIQKLDNELQIEKAKNK